MNKLTIAILAAATALTPAMSPAALAQTPRGDQERDRGGERGGDMREMHREMDRDRDTNDEMGPHRDMMSRERDRDRDDRVEMRRERDRNVIREVRRDDRRHNGFWYGGRFYRGEPTRAQRNARDFRYGYRDWRRGERLSPYERAHYARIANYRAYRLPPPRGYEWRRTDRGDFILAAIATGIITSVILASQR
jgi:Ni/Co efflux regulator RcnB